MDTYSEQQQNGIRIMRHTYFRFDTCDVLSEYAKEACEGKGFGWIWEERDGSSRERSQCLRLRGREGSVLWEELSLRRARLL